MHPTLSVTKSSIVLLLVITDTPKRGRLFYIGWTLVFIDFLLWNEPPLGVYLLFFFFVVVWCPIGWQTQKQFCSSQHNRVWVRIVERYEAHVTDGVTTSVVRPFRF